MLYTQREKTFLPRRKRDVWSTLTVIIIDPFCVHTWMVRCFGCRLGCRRYSSSLPLFKRNSNGTRPAGLFGIVSAPPTTPPRLLLLPVFFFFRLHLAYISSPVSRLASNLPPPLFLIYIAYRVSFQKQAQMQ